MTDQLDLFAASPTRPDVPDHFQQTDWMCPECGEPTWKGEGEYACHWCPTCELHFNRLHKEET